MGEVLRFRDDHLHLMACAAARRSVDVSAATSVTELLAAVREAAHGPGATGGPGEWLRVWGYDDALLVERRHPTVAELDAATGDRPAVTHHITGHVAIVNSAAGRLLGLGGGELLTERHDVLAGVPAPSRAETVAGVAGVLADLVAAGISECTDATHTNDLDALELLAEASGIVPEVEVTAMVGADRLDSLNGRRFGECVESPAVGAPQPRQVRIGHAKVMPPHDDDSAVDGLVAAAREYGFPVAIHAMDIDQLQTALDALEAHPPRVDSRTDRPLAADRIEHCSLALPEQLDRIARLGLKVTTQPSFATRRARKYSEQLSATEQQWLWPLAGLLCRGIEVSFSSDAPTAPSDPAEWIAAASCRAVAPAEQVSAATATRLCAASESSPMRAAPNLETV